MGLFGKGLWLQSLGEALHNFPVVEQTLIFADGLNSPRGTVIMRVTAVPVLRSFFRWLLYSIFIAPRRDCTNRVAITELYRVVIVPFYICQRTLDANTPMGAILDNITGAVRSPRCCEQARSQCDNADGCHIKHDHSGFLCTTILP